MVPKVFRAGYEAINWVKKPRPICHLCHKPISQSDLDSLRAGYATPANRTAPVPYHFDCFNPN